MTTRLVAFAIPGDIATPTGGYHYDRHIIEQLRASGVGVDHVELGPSFPHPSPEDQARAALLLSQIPASCPIIIDGLSLGALDPSALDGVRAPLIALVHHPLAYEGNLEPTRREQLFRTERENLGKVAHVIVPSPHTASLLVSEYGVAEENIAIARPGIRHHSSARRPITPPLILSVGSYIPRKGHDVLIEALRAVSDLAWQAVIVGARLDDEYLARLRRSIEANSLAPRIRLSGPVSDDELQELFASAHVFALATRFEGYGMVFDEAMAHGLPILSCDAGAVTDTVWSDARLLVPPDNAEAFADSLRTVLTDSAAYARLQRGATQAGKQLSTWEDTAATFLAVLDQVGKWQENRTTDGDKPGSNSE